jgi:hypothetical protein
MHEGKIPINQFVECVCYFLSRCHAILKVFTGK